jgi:hypothetical protein
MTEVRYVADLPDLIGADDYAGDPAGRLVRLRLSVTAEGVEILGDALRVDELERLLAQLDPREIEQTLCG